MMKKFLAAALMLAACEAEPQQVRATPEEIALAVRGANVLHSIAVELRPGSECIVALTEIDGSHGTRIMERRDGKLSSMYTSRSWGGMTATSMRMTDMGRDGKKEVEVRLNDGRRIYYLWNGKDEYKGEDALAYHGTSGHKRFRDNVFYRDMDGDGIEEALVVFDHDFSTRSGPTPFDARKWNHGWSGTYENDYLKGIRTEYELAARSNMDALALLEKKAEIRGRLLDYARR